MFSCVCVCVFTLYFSWLISAPVIVARSSVQNERKKRNSKRRYVKKPEKTPAHVAKLQKYDDNEGGERPTAPYKPRLFHPPAAMASRSPPAICFYFH